MINKWLKKERGKITVFANIEKVVLSDKSNT